MKSIRIGLLRLTLSNPGVGLSKEAHNERGRDVRFHQVSDRVILFLLRFAASQASVVSLKFFVKCVKAQKQILRLTTPELKNVRGPFRSE